MSGRRDAVIPSLATTPCQQETFAFLTILFTVDIFANSSRHCLNVKVCCSPPPPQPLLQVKMRPPVTLCTRCVESRSSRWSERPEKFLGGQV